MTGKRRHYGRKPSTEFGTDLKQWRDEAQLTLEEAASNLGLKCKKPAAYLSQIERGHKPIPDAVLVNVARVYHVSPDKVLGKAYWPQLILLPLVSIVDPDQLTKGLIQKLEKGLDDKERRDITQYIEKLLLGRDKAKQHTKV